MSAPDRPFTAAALRRGFPVSAAAPLRHEPPPAVLDLRLSPDRLALPVAPAPQPSLRRTGLCALLAERAHRHPHRVAFIDPRDKPGWNGRGAITWTYGAATEIVARLANGLRGWRLTPSSRIGLCLDGGAESLIAYLAVEAAGHLPCLLPIAWDEDRLVEAAQAAGLSAVLTQGRFGADLPAERLRRVALRYFGLRYLAAFGPDVPDGVISLDALALDERGGPFAPDTGGGLVTFAAGDPARPLHRPAASLLAAIAQSRASVRIAPGDRILTLLANGDLRTVVTGLGAALAAGASLELLPVFDASAFAETLRRPLPTHLVLPARFERNLARSLLPGTLRSISLVHRAPTAFGPALLRSTTDRAIVDVVAFDETAILAGRRGTDDIAETLADPVSALLPPAAMAMRIEADGCLAFRGEACIAGLLQRGITPQGTGEDWTVSRFRVAVRDGRATGATLA